MTTTKTIRRYPRDVTTGTRVLVRIMTGRGPKPRPGTITEITPDGKNRYRVVVNLDSNDTVRLYPAANAKLDTIR